MHRWTRPLSLLLLAVVAPPLESQQRALTLGEAISLAQENNPEVRAQAGEVAAAQARLAGASTLLRDNPSFSIASGPRSSPAGESRDDNFQVLQPFEVFGQRAARIEAARADLGAAEARLRALRVEVAARAREGFGGALAAEQRARLAEEALAVARQGVSAAEERFEAGAAALLEVNTARVELGRMGRERGEAERRLAEALADLNLLLGVDPATPVAPHGELEHDAAVPEEAALLAAALANRPELEAGRQTLEAARAEARLAARERLPVPRLGASYSREEESDTRIVQGLLSFEVPLFQRNRAARGVAAARVAQAEAAMAATDRQVRQEVTTALARVEAARSAAAGYASDVVKAMQDNMELATESYRAGKIDFLQLLQIRRQSLDARREHIGVLEELNAAMAALDRATGRSG